MATTASLKEIKDPESVPILGPRAARLARGPDISQLRPPIKTSISGTRQVIHALETATGEVKKVLLDEINLMYECKICNSIFRSLANLIAHKKTFCKTKYNDVLHMYKDKEGAVAANMQTVVIEAEPVECVEPAQEAHTLENYSPSLELMKTAGILDELGSFSRPCVGPPTNRLLPPGRQSLGAVVSGLKARLDSTEKDFYSKMQKNFESPRPPSSVVHLEPMFETRSAFLQSWRYSEAGETMGQTYRAWQQVEADNRKIRVGPGGEVMFNESTVKLVTGPDGNTYSVSVPIDDDVKSPNFQNAEEEGPIKYPCPICQKTFLAVKKVMSHMVKVHDETLTEAKKHELKIKNNGVVTEGGKTKPGKINDINCRPVKPVQVKLQNLTLKPNGKMNLCEQLSSDQSTVCPIMKTKISDSNKMEKKDCEKAEQINKFVVERETKEFMESAVPSDVEMSIMAHVNRRKVQCKLCSKRFTRSLLVRNHVANVHMKLRRWTCSLCSYGCWSKQVCMEHVATQHRVNNVASIVQEQPKSVYFQDMGEIEKETDLSDSVMEDLENLEKENDEELTNLGYSEKTVENGESFDALTDEMDLEPTEEPVEVSRSIVGVIINENNGSNGLPTPEAMSEENESDVETFPNSRANCYRGRGRGRGKRKGGRTSDSSSNGSEGPGKQKGQTNSRPNSRKRSRDEALGSEDEEVILNIAPVGKIPNSGLQPIDEDTVPDTPPLEENLMDEDTLSDEICSTGLDSQVPKLLIKYAGPDNSSPSLLNKVQDPPPQIILDVAYSSPFKVPANRDSPDVVAPPSSPPPVRARSRSREVRPPSTSSPGLPGSRDSSSSRASSRSSNKSSPPTSSDLDSPRKLEMKAKR